MKKIGALILAMVCISMIVMTGCDQLTNQGKNKGIKVKQVIFNGDDATVFYEDGMQFTVYDILEEPVRYADHELSSSVKCYENPTQEKNQDTDESETGIVIKQDFYKNGYPPISKRCTELGVRALGTNIPYVFEKSQGYVELDGKKIELTSGDSFPTSPDGIFSYNDKFYNFADSYFTEYINSNIKEIVIQESYRGIPVTKIWKGGFSLLTNLEKVTIPSSITQIQDAAFYQCERLKDITFLGTVEQWKAITKGNHWDLRTGNYTVHCIDGDLAKESVADAGVNK